MIKKYCDRCKTMTETGSEFQEKIHTSKNYWGMGINFHLCSKCSKIFHEVLKRFYEVVVDVAPIKPLLYQGDTVKPSTFFKKKTPKPIKTDEFVLE